MRLGESTLLIRAAAEARDLEALELARRERDAAIASLGGLPPSEELLTALRESLAAGEEATRALRLIKQKIRQESGRLAAIEAVFLRALREPEARHIDCQG
ncbi:MAG TPA: hypothetical protein VMT15_06995 [Bryobacteraceae bacterium]|nr:hypothetical protein [Bryobacteraceae bacterium]